MSHTKSSLALRPLRVLVVGGGPVGLLFAATLKTFQHHTANIVVVEQRWKKNRDGSVSWKTSADGVNRREQVVTIQSSVFSSLPSAIQAAIFPDEGYSCVWPTGGESPPSLGHPRNIRIMDIEDRLLEYVRSIGVTLDAYRVVAAEIELEMWDMVVIADGPASRTRDFFEDKFGNADSTPFSVGGHQVEDVVLGLRVKSNLRDPDTVVLTVAQNRFLFNGTGGDGYLYMRLTKHEAEEVRGVGVGGKRFTGCIQSQPCMMEITSQDSVPSCGTHATRFLPALDSHSFLWPRITEGIKLFDCELKAVTVFRLSQELRPKFVTELTDTGTEHPVFGALVGDAANAIHFWPGRGLNHGIYSAVALARCIHDVWQGRNLRSADFTRFEAVMSALQHRHKDRAWRSMVQRRGDTILPVHEIISNAIETSDGHDREALLSEMSRRVSSLARRLSPRLPLPPSVSAMILQLQSFCSVETLNVMVESQAWETRLSGGPETDVNSILPPPVSATERETIERQEKERRESEMQILTMDMVTSSSGEQTSDVFVERDILGRDSIRASFNHALYFAGACTLAWQEAVREIRALLIRANVGLNLTEDDIYDAVEAVDRDLNNRVDADEFEAAVRTLMDKTVSSVERLGDIWFTAFDGATDASGQVAAQMAARLVVNLARDRSPAQRDLLDRIKLRAIFNDRCGNESGLVSRELFLQVVAEVMFGK